MGLGPFRVPDRWTVVDRRTVVDRCMSRDILVAPSPIYGMCSSTKTQNSFGKLTIDNLMELEGGGGSSELVWLPCGSRQKRDVLVEHRRGRASVSILALLFLPITNKGLVVLLCMAPNLFRAAESFQSEQSPISVEILLVVLVLLEEVKS